MHLLGFRPVAAIAALVISLPNSGAEAQSVSTVAELRSAIASARTGATVSITPGTYDIGTRPLRIEGKRSLQIIGAGAGKTIIRASASAPFIFELAGSNNNLEIAGMTLMGASRLTKNTHGLASGSDRMNLTHARFHDLDIRNVAVGISVVGSGNGYCDDVQITTNTLNNIQDVMKPDGVTSGSGYGIHNDGCTNVRIAGNTIRNADRHSIYQASAYQPGRPAASGSIVIDSNRIIDHGMTSSLNNEWQVALVVARSSNVVISRNEIINSNFDAISIEDPSEEKRGYAVRNVSLIDNTVRGARTADVFLTAAGTFTSRGNRFYRGDAAARPVIRRGGKGKSGRLSSEL
jgi:parallel beta helix pectate lyase-like protein